MLIWYSYIYQHPPLAQLVRAQSLYLWGPRFESWRADTNKKQHLHAVFCIVSEPELCFVTKQNKRGRVVEISV